MKKISVLLGIVLIVLLLAACNGGGETEVPTSAVPTEVQNPTPKPTEKVVEEKASMLELTSVPLEDILDIKWQWTEWLEAEPASLSLVPDAENYTLVFREDGTFTFQADCNVGSGEYTTDGSNITLVLGPVTLAACSPDSLHDPYMMMLAHASSFGMNEDKLVLETMTDDGDAQVVFENGGPAEEVVQEPEVCVGIDMQSWALDTIGLPYSWKANCLPATSYDATQPPTPTGLPEHAQINFGVTNPADRKPGDPIVYVIPVNAYELLWESSGNTDVTNSIEQLQKLLVDQPDPIPANGMPILPYEEVAGVNDLSAQGKYLKIKMGSGVRFVGRFSQGANPVSNDNPQLYYIFQGFTDDGVYLISFFYPVSTSALPNSSEVTDEEQQKVDTDSEAYMQEKTDELNALQSSDWEPDLDTLDALIGSLEFEYVPPEVQQPTTPQLTNINWQWSELIETNPTGQTLVPNPEAYTIIFLNDGTVDILADCNFGGGTYALDGDNITITIGAITKIACDPGSLSVQFTTLLEEVSTYQLTIPKLTLNLKDDAGKLGFVNGGQAIIPELPGENVPTATTTEPVNVRSGPGTAYTSYGIVPADTTFEVTGISEDGGWWVVKVPTYIVSSGQGWISANYVVTDKTENVPVVATPPLDGTPPDTDEPMAKALDTINVRSGPGTAYPSYGVAPIGAVAPVVGVSEDGAWWVIAISTDISSDGTGWVNAKYVEVTNAENVPVIPTPPLP
jgi:heat shock protein HslJ/uncharacterized protein YraI